MNFDEIPRHILNDGDMSPTESVLIHAYPGSMPAYLASRLADRYSDEGETVFDPFCGSGAVLIESAKLGRKVLGCELLDISADITRAAFELPDPNSIYERFVSVKRSALEKSYLFSDGDFDESELSDSHIDLSAWFHRETFIEVIALYKEIQDFDDQIEKRLFSLLLSGCLMSLSNRISRGVLHWGWIADNVKPNRSDLLQVNTFSELERRVNRLIDFMRATSGYHLLLRSGCQVINHDWLLPKAPEELKEKSVDLLLTSPPYPYSIDYTLALRLAYYLFEKPFDGSKKNEIGARFKRKRKARSEQYLEDLAKSLRASSKMVKIEGRAVFVLPHPDEYRAVVNMSTDEWLSHIQVSMDGKWKVDEIGFRDCLQRRVVHSSKFMRQELIAAYQRVG